MRLSKFPVKTKNGTYRVDVELVECSIFKYYQSTVYEERNNKIFRWKRVQQRDYRFDDWNGLFVEMAKDTVLEYEELLRQKKNKKIILESGIAAFEQWDGKIT